MVGVNPNRITGRYCPKCENLMLYYGSIKHGMCMCLNNECKNVEKVEDALTLIQTDEGKSIYWAGFERGEDAGITERLSDKEDLSEVE